MAMDFIRYATAAPQLARVAGWVPYGPAQALRPRTGREESRIGDFDAAHSCPPNPHNFATAFAIDDVWWQRHGGEIAPRWHAWAGR